MASETEASCESDPNFAIICAFMEKFGELCGIDSVDFVELQKMLENNQEVSQELVNLHVKLLKKSKKKNVTVERWERALVSVCHTFSSKDAWEIERFGYKNTRLQIKLRALKELLEMQFDYNIKFKNAINKMTSDTLRSEPLGRDKMGRAYWFQTDNNYQIRIYKEDADEETWNLIAKDRAGLVSLISELSDGDSKFSSDSACNEDSNSLLEKPFTDTGQTDNSNDAKAKEEDEAKISPEVKSVDAKFENVAAVKIVESTNLDTIVDNIESVSKKNTVIEKKQPAPQTLIDEIVETPSEHKEVVEVKRPMLRIKSLSELMEKPKEPPKATFLPNLPGITITKKPKLDLPEITIVKKSRNDIPGQKNVQVSPVIQSPLMIIRGHGSGKSNKCGNPAARKVITSSVRYLSDKASDVSHQVDNNQYSTLYGDMESPIVGEEIEEPVMYFSGAGSGRECETGNEKESSKEEEKLKNSNNCSIPSRQTEIGQVSNQVPTSQLSSFKLGTVIDSKTEHKTFIPRDPNKKSRWDQKESGISEAQPQEKNDNLQSPKKMTFFFGPGCLNVKVSPLSNSNASDTEQEPSETKKAISKELDFSSANNVENSDSNMLSEVEKNIKHQSEGEPTNLAAKSIQEVEPSSATGSSQENDAESMAKVHLNCNSTEDAEEAPKETETGIESCEDNDTNCTKDDEIAEVREAEAMISPLSLKESDIVEETESKEKTDVDQSEQNLTNQNLSSKDPATEASELTLSESKLKEMEHESNKKIEEKPNDENVTSVEEDINEELNDGKYDEKIEQNEKVEEFVSNTTNIDEKISVENKVEAASEGEKNKDITEDSKISLDAKEMTESNSSEENNTVDDIDDKIENGDVVTSVETSKQIVEDSKQIVEENSQNVETKNQNDEYLIENSTKTEDLKSKKKVETEEMKEKSEIERPGSELSDKSMKDGKIDDLPHTANIEKSEKKVVAIDQGVQMVEEDAKKDEEVRDEEPLDTQKIEEITIVKTVEDVTKVEDFNSKDSKDGEDISKSETADIEDSKKIEDVSSITDGDKCSNAGENLPIIAEASAKPTEEPVDVIETPEAIDKCAKEVKDPTKIKGTDNKDSKEVEDVTKILETADENSKEVKDITNLKEAGKDSKEADDNTKIEETNSSTKIEETNSSTKIEEPDNDIKADALPSKRRRTTRNAHVDSSSSKVEVKEVPKKKVAIERNTRASQRASKKNADVLPNKPEAAKEIVDIPKEQETEHVEVVEVRTTRQTRQRKLAMTEIPVSVKPVPVADKDESAAVKVVPSAPKVVPASAKALQATAKTVPAKTVTRPTKGKRKGKKTVVQVKEVEKDRVTDSPVPLESVTVVDSDSNCPATDAAETDPLAVSDDEEKNTKKTVSTVTAFSFDYNPDSPETVKPVGRNLRKRGREFIETKPEVGETGGKKPKMKGKRTVDLELRKSVEEKRQAAGVSSDENESVKKTKSEVKTKGGKKAPAKKEVKAVHSDAHDSDSDNAVVKPDKKKKRASGANRVLQSLGITEEEISAIADSSVPMRQSRRLAQLKIKEDATRRKIEDEETLTKKKKKKIEDKDFKAGKRKRIEEEVKPAPTPPMVDKKKQRKKTKHKNIFSGWKSSSEDDASCQEEEEVSEYEEPHEEEPLQFKSDHEFSPESDLENEEPSPLKRARTARKEESDEDEAEEEFHCQKCSKSDHPEWILLCDKCDNGWHCSCLRPALFVIPEGDWYCPTCQHEMLVEKLHGKLVEYDKSLLKKEMEDRRKERLAYVGISLNNVLPAKEKKDKVHEKSSASDSPSSDSTDSDEPIYQLRQRRQAHSYKFQDYDDLINSALQEEHHAPVERTQPTGRGKDIATIVNAAKEEEERNAERNGFDSLPPVVPRDPEEMRRKAISYRKKPKRLNNLEVNSDDEGDDSDEDFKGSSSEESEEDEVDEDSDDSFVGRKRSKAVRRSTRARTTRFDADFINDDDSDYDESSRKKNKKKRAFLEDSESELSDDWRGQTKKSHKSSSRKKSKKKKKYFDDSDLETYRKKKPKIKYGMDSDDETKGRRTRGKRTSYLDTLGSDSEEENLKKKNKEKSDDEYVAEDDEKESEEEEDAEQEKASEEEEEQEDSNKKQFDSDDEGPLVVKKLRIKNRRTIVDSDDEDEVNEEKEVESIEKDPDSKKEEVSQPVTNKDLEPVINTEKNSITNDDTDNSEKSQSIRDLEKQALEKPPSVLVPILNMERLKACGITLTKVASDKSDSSLNIDEEEERPKLIELGNKPPLQTLSQRMSQTFAPINIDGSNKNHDNFEEKHEEYSTRPLHLSGVRIQHVKQINQNVSLTPIVKDPRDPTRPQLPTMMNRKPGDNTLKKVRTGRFFNMKPPVQEPMLGHAPLVTNDDDNDELSEPPGVTLPLFSEIGPSSMQRSPRLNSGGRLPPNSTPPPLMGPNRATPVPLHALSSNRPESMNSQVRPPYSISPGSLSDQKLSVSPEISIGSIGGAGGVHISRVPSVVPNVLGVGGPNVQRPSSVTSPSSLAGHPSSGSSITIGSNLSLGTNSQIGLGDGSPPSSLSPDGTPKKRRGRGISGKGKKTLAAEAAAAAAAGLPTPEQNVAKPTSNKPLVANIEIASPPQPFSQSQPAPSVITRMLQNNPGKGVFPVGRIRPKQFAMMPDNENEACRPIETHGENVHKNIPTHPAPASHPPGPYGAPPPAQYPPNYYSKEGHAPTPPPHGYHPQQRPPPSPMHSYPPNSNAPPVEQQPPLNQPPLNPPAINPPPLNPPTISQPPLNPPAINQPPISISESTPPSLGQYSGTPPPSVPAAKPPFDPMAHRPPYSSQGYNYDYNAPPTQAMNSEEALPAPYENPAPYGEQYEGPGSNLEPNMKNVEDEPAGEFGGLVSYFSSQHEDDLDT